MPKLTAIRKQALDEMMKEALFEASVTVLGEHGVKGITMDRVASAAGMAKGSLYHYFCSKKDLLKFVYKKMIDPIFEDLSKTMATNQTAIEKLASHLFKILEHVGKYAKVFKLLFDDDTSHGLLQSSERSTREVGSRHLAEIFRQGIADGVFHPADPFMLAHMFLGICKGVFESQPELQEPSKRENIHQLILSTFLNGITAKKDQVG